MIAPAVALMVAAFIAGHPTQVLCDVPPTAVVVAWTNPGSSVIHMQEDACAGLAAKPGDLSFAHGLSALIHESAHARGVRSEACAEAWADLTSYDVLRRFWHVPFFTPLSWLVGAQIREESRRLPASYQFDGQSCDMEVH